MILGAITAGLFLGMNLIGVLWTLSIIRFGRAGRSVQEHVPKQGLIRKRAPLMLGTALGVAGASFLGIWWLEFAFTTAWVGFGSFVAQFAIILLVDDAYFYAIHRAMHSPKLYRIHKVHHRSTAPVPVDILYQHPIESLVVLGGVGAALVVIFFSWGAISFHAFIGYMVVRQMHELRIHSGVRSALSIFPGVANTRHHDQHHAKPHQGNFGSMLMLWDKVMKTEIPGKKRSSE